MQIRIFQINSDRDKERLKFSGMDELEKLHGNADIDSALYDEVFRGNLDCADPEEVFDIFNREGHPLFRGHSLSVSDIVLIEGNVPLLAGVIRKYSPSGSCTTASYTDPELFAADVARAYAQKQDVQHIAFLKDFFRAYKDFSDAQIDTIEILLMKLYARFGITDSTDYTTKRPSDFPIMSDFYKLCQEEFHTYDRERKYLYTEEMLQEVCLGIHSMCVGAESKYFNGHTNIVDDKFLCFGVKGLMDTNKRLKDAMLFNILSYMSNELLGKGNTAASIDELYLFLTNMTAIEYIRNAMKRVRKKDSSIILASQNIEDFLIPSIRELTKPLFSIPTHQFLFNAGQINPKDFMDALQVEPSEFELIKYPERGTCLYRCGNERYLLQVIAPDYKSALFGKAGGR